MLVAAAACGDKTTEPASEASFCQSVGELIDRADDVAAPERAELEELREILSRAEAAAPSSIGPEVYSMTADYGRILDTWVQADFELDAFLDVASRDVRTALERLANLPSTDSSGFSESEPESAVLGHVEDRC
jgi:hypothetical protein